jgi:hypothetical protein
MPLDQFLDPVRGQIAILDTVFSHDRYTNQKLIGSRNTDVRALPGTNVENEAAVPITENRTTLFPGACFNTKSAASEYPLTQWTGYAITDHAMDSAATKPAVTSPGFLKRVPAISVMANTAKIGRGKSAMRSWRGVHEA